MKQEQFIQHNEGLWQSFETQLEHLESSKLLRKLKRKKNNDNDAHNTPIDIPQAYRSLCQHLALAQSRQYSPLLIEKLNALVTRGHRHFYAQSYNTSSWQTLKDFYLWKLPCLVRKEWLHILLASLLFYVPFFGLILWLQWSPEMIYTLIDPAQLHEMESMYNPDIRDRLGRERESDSDILMFGHYIKNNTGIDFQIFAGGLLFGIGTVFFLLFNGVFIGAVAGHLTQLGYIETFWGFISGHSAFELTGMVLAGAAGFKLAAAFYNPGRRRRLDALIANSKISITLIYGAATLTIMAAFVEAFWSSIAWMPVWIKYAMGLLLWSLTLSYFWFMGRSHEH